MAKKKAKFKDRVSEGKSLNKALRGEFLRLSTNSFGLVAALAWNEFIKETIQQYIKPFAGKGSGIMSMFIYAVIVTVLAVGMTYSLTKLVEEKKKD